MADLDSASALMRYLPGKGTATKISFTGTSSAFALVNGGPSPRWYVFACTEDCYIVCGYSDVAAAADTDALLPAGIHDFVLLPRQGVRVIRVSDDGILTIAPAGV